MEKTDNIEKIRHSLSHLLAIAILEKYPGGKLGIGPTIENGFYYDFLLEDKISDSDLPKIQKRIKQLIRQNLEFKVKKVTPSEAKKALKNQPFKHELIEQLKKDKKNITLYKTGEIFTDLCAGPHVKNTKEIKEDTFKLHKIAGAYWQGDEKREMLTRIYGLAFDTKKELEEYEQMLAEAEKRDHRKLGAELDLFTFSKLVGSGLPLFTPRGTIIREELQKFVTELQEPLGYQRVTIPHITKPDLYKTSGHWDKFKEDLFHVKGKGSNDEYVMKPMNCPHHTQIFDSKLRTYKELPVRFAEFGVVYRNEKPGELQGLSRVLSITQDDGHVFCAEDQIADEIITMFKIVKKIYNTFNMPLEIHLSTHDSKDFSKYLGDKKVWDKSIKILKNTLKENKMDFVVDEGEAAFYGPKIDFKGKDSLGRLWQVATIQVDYNLPQRFELSYIDEKGNKKVPVMIHRAFLGSIERFMSIMIEHFAGAFPAWLAPEQVRIIPVNDKVSSYTTKLYKELKEENIRVHIDESNDTLGKKIRNAEIVKIPYTLIIGDKEKKEKNISVRSYKKGDLGQSKIDKFIKQIKEEIIKRK